jgi:small subunit ribosomal protein S10
MRTNYDSYPQIPIPFSQECKLLAWQMFKTETLDLNTAIGNITDRMKHRRRKVKDMTQKRQNHQRRSRESTTCALSATALTCYSQVNRLSPEQRDVLGKARLPKNLQAMYLRPLKRTPTHGIPVCSLQIRSFSVRNLELYADFAMRAAYYMGLPAKGPVPLPHITQRWTVPRSNFVHKKSQENFERVTVRRAIQILDGDPEVVQCWLGYLQQKAYHGIGMKAHMWEHEGLGVGKRMDELAGVADAGLEDQWGNFGTRLNVKTAEAVEELLGSEAFSKPRRFREAFWREPIEVIRKKLTGS